MTAIILLLIPLIIAGVFRWRKVVPPTYDVCRQWLVRTVVWGGRLVHSNVDDKGIKFSDLVSVFGLLLTIMGIWTGWYRIKLESEKVAFEQEVRDLNSKSSAIETDLASSQNELQELHGDTGTLYLLRPVRDAQVVHDHVDLQWSYATHNQNLRYVVEISRRDRRNRSVFDPAKEKHCYLDVHKDCRYFADPPEQGLRVELNASHPKQSIDGDYLWRVVPVHAAAKMWGEPGDREMRNQRLANWSEYSMFTIYPNLKQRMVANRALLVGTVLGQDRRFSSRNEEGVYAGHDIDLIKLLVQGCLTLNTNGTNSTLLYDEPACKDSTERFLNHKSDTTQKISTPRVGQLDLKFVPFSEFSEALTAVKRHAVDLVIGSLTRASFREETGTLKFTDGYYAFNTALYARSVPRGTTVNSWKAKSPRNVGVIEGSTNQTVASLMSRPEHLGAVIRVVSYPSFSALEEAFHNNEVDSVLVDSTVGPDVEGPAVSKVEGLEDLPAWAEYLQQIGARGRKEEFSIAVAVEPAAGTNDAQLEVLFLPLQQALKGLGGRRDKVLRFLRTRYVIPPEEPVHPRWSRVFKKLDDR